MLRSAKILFLKAARATGVSSLLGNSSWRRQRLLVLCYHGVSIDDEHVWNPGLYLSPKVFESRLQTLRRHKMNILGFAEAVKRLQENDLPPRSVAITFDDGGHDFYASAFPLIRKYDLPALVYLTTYFAVNRHPIFRLSCDYILWKSGNTRLQLEPFTGTSDVIDATARAGRETAHGRIASLVEERQLDTVGRTELLRRLAEFVGVDFEDFLRKQILHIMSPEEVQAVARGGVAIELHTHRHRTPSDPELFLRELNDNNAAIHQMTGRTGVHFCYPSGVTRGLFLPVMKKFGIQTATTCEAGLATRETDPYFIPRMLDVNGRAQVDFEGWLSGISSFLPRRA